MFNDAYFEQNIFDINLLVQSIIDKNFEEPIYNKTIVNEFMKKNMYDDPLINIKNELTNFITKHFFDSTNSFKNFLNLVNDLFTNSINLYKQLKNLHPNDIIFLYKGGGFMNILFKKTMLQFPDYVNQNLLKEYSSYFKKSDCDFGIIINPNFEIKYFEEVYADMTRLSYLLCNRIRNIFLTNLQKYFDLYKYKDKYINDLLSKLIKNLNNNIINKLSTNSELYNSKVINIALGSKSYCINNHLDIKPYTPYKNDIFIKSNLNNNTCVHDIYKMNITNQYNISYFLTDYNLQNSQLNVDNEFYIKYNKDNIEYKLNNRLCKFNLIRIKVNFTLHYLKNDTINKINLPGELLDISIPHIYSDEHVNFYNNLSLNITDVYLFNSYYKVYSLEYLIHDLINILFGKSYFPWSNNKYKKRLNRLLFLCYFNTLNFYDVEQTIIIITSLLESIDFIGYTNSNNLGNDLDSIDFCLLNIMTLIDITKNRKNIQIQDVEYSLYDNKYFEEFIFEIKKSLEIFLNSLEKLLNYKNNKKLIVNNIKNIENDDNNDC